MTDPIDEITQPPSNETQIPEPAPVKTKSHPLLPLFLALVAIVGVVISFFYFKQTLHDITTQQTDTLNSLQSQVATTQQQMQQQTLSIDQTSTALNELRTSQMQQQQMLHELSASTHQNDNAWKLAEVEYFLRLANTNLDIERRPEIAIHLLQAADTELSHLNDPLFTPVRRAITQNITDLQTIKPVDIEALLLKIDTLQENIAKLTLVKPKSALTTVPTAITPSSRWQDKLLDSLKFMERIIIIRHHNQPIEPLLSADQSIYLIENLHLILERASWAILHQQQTVYAQALTQAEQSIKSNYINQDQTTTALLSSLAELKNINIHPSYPSISSSLTALLQVKANSSTQTGNAA